MIAGTPLLLTNCVYVYKILLVLSQQKRIQALLDITKSTAFTTGKTKYQNMVSRYTWQGMFHYIFFQSMAFIGTSCWTITPIMSKRYPIRSWYPFDTTATSIFIATSFHQIFTITLISWHNIAIDSLINDFITVACCQLAILRRNIATINQRISSREIKSSNNNEIFENNTVFRNRKNVEDGSSVVKETELNKYDDESEQLYEELRRCVKHSNSIFEFAEEHQNIFTMFIFSQLATNCIIIYFTAFQITQIKIHSASTFIGTILYGLCMLYQVFIYCWHGSELQYHGTQVALAAYSNIWWVKSTRFKRALQIIMTRMQRPLIFRAENVMKISLETFLAIMKVSYSVFTVLLSINK